MCVTAVCSKHLVCKSSFAELHDIINGKSHIAAVAAEAAADEES